MSAIELQTHVVTSSMHSATVCDAKHGNDLGETNQAGLEETNGGSTNTLMHYCSKIPTSSLFLRFTANYWPIDGNWRCFDRWYYGLTRFINIASIFVNIFGIFYIFFAPNYPNEAVRYVSAGIDFTIVIRTVSVVVVQYLNQCRIQHPAHAHEILVVEESAKVAGIYGIVVLLSNILSTFLLAFSSVPENAGILSTEYFLGTYLSISLFFLILDIKASSVLLDQLHLLADNRKLTMDVFVSSRADIHRRVRESRWACDLIVVPCVASATGILILIIYFLDTPARPALKIEAAAFVCIMLKELFFVAVAFWYVAKVNARADELTVKLSKGLWGMRNSLPNYGDVDYTNNGTSTPENTVTTHVSVDGNGSVLSNRKTRSTASSSNNIQGEIVHISDIHRLSIHASSISEPVSFTLLFKRVSWRNIAVSTAGFIVAILIAVIKNAVETSIEG